MSQAAPPLVWKQVNKQLPYKLNAMIKGKLSVSPEYVMGVSVKWL